MESIATTEGVARPATVGMKVTTVPLIVAPAVVVLKVIASASISTADRL